MDVQVYKIITWVAQAVIILAADVTKIRSNELLIDAYAEMTLFEMWDAVSKAATCIP